MPAADALEHLYQWAKDMYAQAEQTFETTKDIPTIQLETGRMGAYRALITVLDEWRAEGFTDAAELVSLRERVNRQLHTMQQQSELLERQSKAIDTQQTVIANYEAVFSPSNSQKQ